MPVLETTTAEETERRPEQRPPVTTDLAVTGMTCGNCARHVSEAIQSVEGVRTAEVSLDAQSARVRWNSGEEPKVEAVVQAAEGLRAPT